MQVVTRVALAAVFAACLPAAAHAASRPDLTVVRVAEPPATIAPAGKLAASDSVRNAGRARAKAFSVGYWLSKDRRRSADDVLLGTRAQRALARRRTGRGGRAFSLPAVLAPGVYHLIACADSRGKVKERSERNNCRASARRVTVAAALAPVAPVAPQLPATPQAPSPSNDARFPAVANPLAVTHTLEQGNAVTKRVTGGSQFTGGTLVATASNGTKYTLEVPPAALVSDQEITMTPVAAVNGSPLTGGLLGAVEILPHGLELLKPAKLTIEPAGGAGPIAGQTGFLSHEAGEDFHLYPLALGEPLVMHLTHFSTPGVAQATDAERQVVLSHPPERHRAQYEQMMSELIRDTRAKQLADANATLPADAIAEIFRGYWNDIVHPLAEQAYTDDTLAARAIAELLSWARHVDLLSLHEHPALKVRRNVVMQMVTAIMENAVNKGYARCVGDHDLDYIARLVGLARAAALIGSPLGDAAFDKAERCGTFRFDFDSVITESHGYVADDGRTAQTDGRWRAVAEVTIPITGLAQGAPMSFSQFSFLQELTYPCGSSGGTLRNVRTGTTTAADPGITVLLGMDLNPREPGTPPPADRDIRVRMFDFDDGTETYQDSVPSWCGNTAPTPVAPVTEKRWLQHYNSFHTGENGIFEDWQIEGGDLVATKSYVRSNPNWGIAENTLLEVWHTPET